MRHQIKLTIANVFFLLVFVCYQPLQARPVAYHDLTDSVNTKLPTGTDSAKTTKAAKAEATLVGRWENPYFVLESPSNREDTNGRSLRYHFRADGTYTKVLGGAETQIEETGTWEVSADGEQVLMRSRSVCSDQAVTHTARIKHLSADELVLEQTMCVAGVMVTTEPQEFYFNKF